MWVLDEFENQLVKDLRDDAIHGSLSAAVIRHNQIIRAKAFGYSTMQGEEPAATHTIYRAGSVAKSFTALLMMQLIQAGAFALDEPVENHFPEVRKLQGYSDNPKITFRQLASHTSGLMREPKLEGADAGPIEAWEDKVLQSIPHTSFESKPGERFSYSNIGYGILGVALSRAGGEPFIKMIEERIFQPLGMQDSFFIVPDHRMKDLAQGIEGGPFGDAEPDLARPHKEHRGRGYKVPNGGIYSTPTDLAKFLMCNMGYPTLLERGHLDVMHANQTPETSYHCYGLGYELYKDPLMTIVGHSGGVSGYSAYIGFEKECGYGVVLMRNYNWGTTSWDFAPKILLRKLVELERNGSS